MARPSKSAKVLSECSQTKAEIAERTKAENKLKGDGKPVPPEHLNKEQKRIFRKIVKLLDASDILSELDSDVLGICAIAIDRLAEIESRMNNEPELIGDTKLMSAKEKYSKDFFRCCNELCLSPQSRAKMANMSLAKKEPDPLLKILAGDN